MTFFTEGKYTKARFVESPNFDERPKGSVPEVVIIHSISLPPGEYGENFVEAFFCNQLNPKQHSYFEEIHDLTVSAHFFIRRDGECVQFVNANKRAWHAGVSECQGRECVNDFSIGVELEGWDEADDGFTETQYATLVELGTCLMQEYGIDAGQFYGHSDIAPGRKNDPGPNFDWKNFRKKLVDIQYSAVVKPNKC